MCDLLENVSFGVCHFVVHKTQFGEEGKWVVVPGVEVFVGLSKLELLCPISKKNYLASLKLRPKRPNEPKDLKHSKD